jgi:hypothetical protein
MPRNGLIWRGILSASVTMGALSMASCMQELPLLEPNIPDAAKDTDPVPYRSLSSIPEKPLTTPAEMHDQDVNALTAERAATADAANRLREAPFTTPDPPAPPGSDAP